MVSVFFSYSHKDEALRDELGIHLATLKRQGVIETWHDRRIDAGAEFDDEIARQMDVADIILLLVSPYFLASDYCYEKEMKRALERHKAKEARVIPVILHQCEWRHSPIGHLRATPTDGKPVSGYKNLHEAFYEIVSDIRRVATKPSGSAMTTPPDSNGREAPPAMQSPEVPLAEPQSSDNDARQALHQQMKKLVDSYTDADARMREELRPHLSQKLPRDSVNAGVEEMCYYIASMRPNIMMIKELPGAIEMPAMAMVAQHLVSYLDNPDDLLPESKYGAWGYLDDAWLIHNTALRLVDAGLMLWNASSVSWDRIVRANKLATALLPVAVRIQLQDYLEQITELLRAEVSGFVPEYFYDDGSLNPSMWQAAAMGEMYGDGGAFGDLMDAQMAGLSLDYWND